MYGRDRVVIGGSAGSLEPLKELLAGLPANFPAAVFIVVHLAPSSPGLLPSILNQAGPLFAANAQDGEEIRPGRVYLAPPDHHLLIKGDSVLLTKGPKENSFRPAVDPLFRTAAWTYGPRVVGILLSGGMDDGTFGLMVIKKKGGLAVVQTPEEAAVNSMPRSALEQVEIDHVLSVKEMPALLIQVARKAITQSSPEAHPDPQQELDMESSHSDFLHPAGLTDPPTSLTCPECGGALWELHNGKLTHYRCHLGHAFSAQGLLLEQVNEVEAALWAAVRLLEENAALGRRMAKRARDNNLLGLAQDREQKAQEAESRAAILRKLLLKE